MLYKYIYFFLIIQHRMDMTFSLNARLRPELSNSKSEYPLYTMMDISLIGCISVCGYDNICHSVFFYNQICEYHSTTYTNLTGLVYQEGYRYYTLDKGRLLLALS